MDPGLGFGLSIMLGFVTWGFLAKHYFWPVLRAQPGRTSFRPILLLHSFRFIGLAFLVPGVVSPDLPRAFAAPAAYGDLVASLLALVTLAALETNIGPLLLWVFNLWGTGDLLFAYYQGRIGVGVEPGHLGAMYFVPTVVVPLLLVTHVLAFRMLLAVPPRAA
jgi:hypothetical protein